MSRSAAQQGISWRKARGLLVALVASLHFLAVPCAMAMTAPPDDGGGCEHCDVVIGDSPCIVATDGGCTDETLARADRFRDPPAPADLPAAVEPFPTDAASSLERARPASVSPGRHPGDPPLHLLYGHLRN